nr:GntR family transcriptional regulator [Devosia sp. A16]
MAKQSQAMAEAAPQTRKRGHGVQKVYDRLRQSILDLSLPPGSPLDEMRLSEEFALSRTPIREAMVRLAAEGLLTTLPNRNTIVAPIDFVNLPVYFEALTLMYRVTTRAAAVHRRPEHLVRIRAFEAAYADAVRRHDALGMIAINRDFHVAVAEAGGNVYFTQLFARLLDEGRRVMRVFYYSFDDRLPRQYVDEHADMVAAIEAGDADRADALAATHAAQIVRQIQSYISRETTTRIDLALQAR